jgi:hypothetical protein
MSENLISDTYDTAFSQRLEAFASASGAFRQLRQQELLSQVERHLQSEEGLAFLSRQISALEGAGMFKNSPWADPSRLVPSLVRGTLLGHPPSSTLEVLSELRLIALSKGRIQYPGFSAAEATDFLERTLVHLLDLAFGESTELLREKVSQIQLKQARLLAQWMIKNLDPRAILGQLKEEIEMKTAQQPIDTQSIRDMLRLARLAVERTGEPAAPDLAQYLFAVEGPAPLARQHPQAAAYRQALKEASPEALKAEARAMGQSLRKTGLVSPYHLLLLGALSTHSQELIPDLLGLKARGKAEFKTRRVFCLHLLEKTFEDIGDELLFSFEAVDLLQGLWGLAGMLERGLLSREPVRRGLEQLIHVQFHPFTLRNLLQEYSSAQKLPPRQLLLAGTFSMLGRPLGVGQGNYPTCQAARGLSLWSMHAPGKLLRMLLQAVVQNELHMRFEGKELVSNHLPVGLVKGTEYRMDPVSAVLVPHLDRIYNEMMRRAAGRSEDPHKWVNPALYGHWIPIGFTSAISPLGSTVLQFEHFLRTFFASHHPAYNGGHQMLYPNPVGLVITGPHGTFLGFHAVSLLRIAEGPEGKTRAYFLNPNNEGRQDWGQGITPAVHAHGERPGESSLPLTQFASRIYAFHYNEGLMGEPTAVPQSILNPAIQLARDSWGKHYQWKN